MKWTVPATSKSLFDILWNKLALLLANSVRGSFVITIQNLWEQDLYMEYWFDAEVSEWVKLPVWSWTEVSIKNLKEFNMISDWWVNSNVRFIIT